MNVKRKLLWCRGTKSDNNEKSGAGENQQPRNNWLLYERAGWVYW